MSYDVIIATDICGNKMARQLKGNIGKSLWRGKHVALESIHGSYSRVLTAAPVPVDQWISDPFRTGMLIAPMILKVCSVRKAEA
jgi:hypothetical protein